MSCLKVKVFGYGYLYIVRMCVCVQLLTLEVLFKHIYITTVFWVSDSFQSKHI